MADNWGQTVREILKRKRAGIKSAPLAAGSPGWDDIMNLKWEEIVSRAKRRLPGYKTIKKLLSDEEYDK